MPILELNECVFHARDHVKMVGALDDDTGNEVGVAFFVINDQDVK